MSRCIACSHSRADGMSADLLARGLLLCLPASGYALAFDAAGEPVEHRTPCPRFREISAEQVAERMQRLGRADYRPATPRSDASGYQPTSQPEKTAQIAGE